MFDRSFGKQMITVSSSSGYPPFSAGLDRQTVSLHDHHRLDTPRSKLFSPRLCRKFLGQSPDHPLCCPEGLDMLCRLKELKLAMSSEDPLLTTFAAASSSSSVQSNSTF
mmetsp:Transcript_31573/g.94477  ORF Transcript_31573/g.94477 Transcript_31573/m.94477 type:complete len:109 (+) Transcript_31573:254-580(+)